MPKSYPALRAKHPPAWEARRSMGIGGRSRRKREYFRQGDVLLQGKSQSPGGRAVLLCALSVVHMGKWEEGLKVRGPK